MLNILCCNLRFFFCLEVVTKIKESFITNAGNHTFVNFP